MIFGLHILNSYHAWNNVLFSAYSKIKDFIHRGQPHQARRKSWNYQKSHKKSWNFENCCTFEGGDEGVPCVRNLWLSSMLSYEHSFQRGLDLKYVIWKVLKKFNQKKLFFFKLHFILFLEVRGSDGLHLAVSFTEEPNCFHLRSNCSQLVAHTKMLLNSSYQKTFWGWLKGRSLGTYLWQASKQTEIWSTLRSVGGYWATINRSTSTLGSTRLLN